MSTRLEGASRSVEGCLNEIGLFRTRGGKLNRSILSDPVLGQPNPPKFFLIRRRKSKPQEDAGTFFTVAIIIFVVKVRRSFYYCRNDAQSIRNLTLPSAIAALKISSFC
jgi:hypothetical protein